MNDARTLVAIALQSTRPEFFEHDWTQARIEAAVRRVIKELEQHVGLTVQQETERQDAMREGEGVSKL